LKIDLFVGDIGNDYLTTVHLIGNEFLYFLLRFSVCLKRMVSLNDQDIVFEVGFAFLDFFTEYDEIRGPMDDCPSALGGLEAVFL